MEEIAKLLNGLIKYRKKLLSNE
ncbi:hypothetical protein ACI760_09425 [Capnocytophaga canimorsus]